MVENTKHYINSQQALAMAKERGIKISVVTLHYWASKHQFGMQPGGPGCRWYIDSKSFERFLNGKKHSTE